MSNNGIPKILRDFLSYHETIKGHSQETVDEYLLDMRSFFRFLKLDRGLVGDGTDFEDIDISDIDLEFVRTVTATEVYDFLSYLSRDRVKSKRSRCSEYGLSPATRARKLATIKSFYKYLTAKAKLITENPVKDLDAPKVPRSLPKYLTLDESKRLLESINTRNKARDYCIICIFLNCGLRISEIVGLNRSDVRGDNLRIHGKGGKERVVYLNDATSAALNDYLAVRDGIEADGEPALFLSNRRARMSREAVHAMVKKSLAAAGLDSEKYSAHKLRHTAATLMLQNGVDVRTLQEVLGHEHLNTTQIYTHVDSSELRTAALANPLAGFSPNKPTAEDGAPDDQDA
ncbi:MAG: tyrosine recombinase XerC [Oscillospiraceae bacterium]|nr:tyrosine recombinase XerC [Oscillospiraceae bacterium]